MKLYQKLMLLFLLASNGQIISNSSLAKKSLWGKILIFVTYHLLRNYRAEYAQHPYHALQAQVRRSFDVSDEEKIYVQQRLPKVKAALETLLSTTLVEDDIPKIAFCCSGGGYRAMINTLGALEGAEKIGLYDATLYAAGLSGSAWSLIALGQHPTAATTLEHLSGALSHALLEDVDYDDVTDSLLYQIAFTKRCSLVSFYGALLAQKIFKTNNFPSPNQIPLSLPATLNPSTNLFPICSAVIDRDDFFEWVEFNPFEVGSLWTGGFIPTWSFGRPFKAGVSTNYNPPQRLDFLMGVWGSSFCANMREIAASYIQESPSSLTARIATQLVQELPEEISEHRIIAPAAVPNWEYATEAATSHQREMPLLDAGFAMGLPVPPLLRPARAVDILIMIDANMVRGGENLRAAELYAQKNNLPFPQIDYTQMNKPFSVHADWNNPHAPVIIYCPLMAQPDYNVGWDPLIQQFTNTFNFSYSSEDVLLLSGLSKYGMVQNKGLIIETIKKVVEMKRQSRSLFDVQVVELGVKN